MAALLSHVQAASCGVQQGARQVAGRSAAAAPVSGMKRVTARGSAFTGGGSVRLSSRTRGCVGALSAGERQDDDAHAIDDGEKKQQRVVIHALQGVFFCFFGAGMGMAGERVPPVPFSSHIFTGGMLTGGGRIPARLLTR